MWDALPDAERKGAEEYRRKHAKRREEAEARATRVAKRKEERRVKYLEIAPNIRSAARYLKARLLREGSDGGEMVTCYYCHSSIPAKKIQLCRSRRIFSRPPATFSSRSGRINR